MDKVPQLLMFLPAPARLLPDGRVSLSKKLVSGLAEHLLGWPGAIRVVLPPASTSPGIEDAVYEIAALPFRLTVASLRQPEALAAIEGASVVMFSAQVGYNAIPPVCRSYGVPCIGITEYTLQTRWDIARAEARDALRLVKRIAQEALWEMGNRKAVKLSAGIQSNGIPTYEAYRSLNRNTLLYLDTRVRAADLATAETLQQKFSKRRESGKLRLAFSGRLAAMKGADQLVPLARALARAGAPFELTICGSGELERAIANDIVDSSLSRQVRMTGSLDFTTELLPLLKNEVDVFVCCHPQGDPSCTYLETMSCGVPIIGFANEAFVGLQALSQSGWVTPIGRPDLMARHLSKLGDAEIDAQAISSLEFASKHTFEIEFDRRMQQVRQIAGVR